MSHRPVIPAITEYLYGKSALSGVPISGTFELTPVCNMDCRMCYVRMTRQQQEAIAPLATAEQWLDLARQCRDAGMLYLLITGGEPFLHPQIRQILTGLHKMGFVVSINSNGTFIDEETVAWLRDVPPSRINISLYGASNDTYSDLCGEPKGFDRTTKAIRLLKEAGVQVKLGISATPYNAKDLPAVVAFADQNDLVLQVATYMFPPLRRDPAMVGKNQRFTPREAAWYTAYADYLIYGREDFLRHAEKLTCPGYPEENCTEVSEGIRCRAGKCSFWVTWEGKLLPCGMMATPDAPNVFAQPFSQAWETVRTESAKIRLPAKCTACPVREACKACAAMVLTETGGYDRVPEYRCQMAQALYTERKRLANQLLEEDAE